jgi:hypothetical protein
MSKSAEGSLTEIHHDRVISIAHEIGGPDRSDVIAVGRAGPEDDELQHKATLQ